MASTVSLRSWWSQWRCAGNRMVRTLILGVNAPINPLAAEAQRALGMALTATGYRPRQGNIWAVQTYNCRQITGSFGYSLHSYGIAWDIDPAYNPYKVTLIFRWSDTLFTPVQIAAVEAIRTKAGKRVFVWGGRWLTKKDYMHFELNLRPSDMAVGIDWSTVKGVAFEEDEMANPVLRLGAVGNDVAMWKRALNKARVENDIPLPAIPEGTWFSPEMQKVLVAYQQGAQITDRIPEVGALDLYTMLMLVEYTREGD